jgi:flagellar FliL protein
MSSPEDSPSRRGGKKWLLLAAVVILAGSGVVALQRRGSAPEHAVKKPAASEPGVVELEPFVLNLADPTGDRYFRITVRLVLDRREIAERAASGLGHVKLRDRILSVLSRKRASEMTSLDARESLRDEILAASQALLAAPPFHDAGSEPARVVDVYFTEFLVQ